MSIVGGDKVDPVGQMLELLGDPVKLQRRYDDLKQRQKAAEDVVALVGPAEEVLRLREETNHIHIEAQEQSKQARVEAERIVEEAKTQALAIYGDAVNRATEADDKAQATAVASAEARDEAAAILADAQKAADKVAKDRAILDARAKVLEDREHELDALIAAHEERVSIFQSAKDAFHKAVVGDR